MDRGGVPRLAAEAMGTGENRSMSVGPMAGKGFFARPAGHAAGLFAHSAYGSCPVVMRSKPAGNGSLRGPTHTWEPHHPTAVPNSAPRAYVTPAAAPPRRSCRRPLYHQLRAVTLATTAPHRKRPSSASSTAGHRLLAPSRYGSTGSRAPSAKEPKLDTAATVGEGRSEGSTPSSSRAWISSACSGSLDSCRAT